MSSISPAPQGEVGQSHLSRTIPTHHERTSTTARRAPWNYRGIRDGIRGQYFLNCGKQGW